MSTKKLLITALLAAAGLARAQLDVQPVPALPQASALPVDWQHGVFMEIFVRGYQDSDGDGIGDLRGLIRRLDYLKKLGVSGLWLMPITASSDHDHGYATTDYRRIEPQYGTLEDFDTLIREAHKRGIGIVMDYVINHASWEFPAFQAALRDRDGPWRNWFVWNPDPGPGWDIWGKYPWYDATTQPWTWQGEWKDMPAPRPGSPDVYFGTFGPQMPDFNLRNPAVVRYHEDSLRFWLNRGLDGYRLDAAPHLIENNARDWNDQPESRALTKHFQDLIKSYPGRYVVCEATAKPIDYGAPELCGGAFAFNLHADMMAAAKGEAEAVQRVADYYRSMSPTMATFLHNHDIFTGQRVWDQLHGDEARYRLAAASYLLLPGTPFVYYGEEIGLAGIDGKTPRDDAPLRAPMSWTPANEGPDGFSTSLEPYRPLSLNRSRHNAESQQRDPDSLFNFYRRLIALRRALPSLTLGRYEADQVVGQAWSFQRVHGRERSLVVINYGDRPAQLRVQGLPSRARGRAAYPQQAATLKADASGQAAVTLPPLSLRVYRIEAP
ncbi:alpha-amylase family glycosyl hydrolase [Roseateles sp.]|uniref:alpha-amylase family glycosyl hydrolase n=1 Tax=Roseateles sp. TaxID=1971397 RepID=UPI002E00AE2F|nr:alpha-amylase family glycosyl hydrolase [Roseateles sp.]HEV6964941.1 alpha-amylase family glycosyl hydrolase [Roseateles sp.]